MSDTVKVTLNDCGINISDGTLTFEHKTLLPAGKDALSLEYAINGGYIKAYSCRWMDIRGDYANTIFGNNGGGYTQHILPASEEISAFEDASGWSYNSEALSETELSDTLTAANYLKNTKYAKAWSKEIDN